MSQDLDLAGLALFVRIVETGSLSAAGRSLALPKATVSRRLALLEASVGAPLLSRSSRALSPTDAGRRLFERVRALVHEAEQVQAELRAARAEPSGLLKVAAPVSFGEGVIAPALMAFLRRYPRLRAELVFSDEPVDVIGGGFDLAIRIGELADSELLGKHLADLPMAVVAAPTYLAAHPAPQQAADLREHTAVLTARREERWRLGREEVRVPWRICTGNMSVTREAARAGLGLAHLPAFYVEDDLAAGRLLALLPQLPAWQLPVTAVYPRTAVPSLALRALLDALPDWCGGVCETALETQLRVQAAATQ